LTAFPRGLLWLSQLDMKFEAVPLFVSALAVAPATASTGTFANIYGLCNHNGDTMEFINHENGLHWTVLSGKSADVKSDHIPKAENAGDWNKHRIEIHTQNLKPGDAGYRSFSIWKDESVYNGWIKGGEDYGSGKKLADIPSKGQWIVIVSATGEVSLYPSADPNYCPPAPAPPCDRNHVTDKSGEWHVLQTVGTHQTLEFSRGVTHSYTHGSDHSWSQSVTTSVEAGFEAFGADTKVTVSSTTAYELTLSHSTTFETSYGEKFTEDFDAGTVWQWAWAVTDGCGKSQITSNDLVLTRGVWDPPCCLPGYAYDARKPTGRCMAAKGDKVYRSPKCEPQLDAVNNTDVIV